MNSCGVEKTEIARGNTPPLNQLPPNDEDENPEEETPVEPEAPSTTISFDAFGNPPRKVDGGIDSTLLRTQVKYLKLNRYAIALKRSSSTKDWLSVPGWLEMTKDDDFEQSFILYSSAILKKKPFPPHQMNFPEWIRALKNLSETYHKLKRVMLDDFFDGTESESFSRLNILKSMCDERGDLKFQPVLYCGKKTNGSFVREYTQESKQTRAFRDLAARPELEGCFDSVLIYAWPNDNVSDSTFQGCLDDFSGTSLERIAGVYVANTSNKTLSHSARLKNIAQVRKLQGAAGVQFFAIPAEPGQGVYAEDRLSDVLLLRLKLKDMMKLGLNFFTVNN